MPDAMPAPSGRYSGYRLTSECFFSGSGLEAILLHGHRMVRFQEMNTKNIPAIVPMAVAYLSFFPFFACGMASAAQATAPATVHLSPGDDLQSKVNVAPPGTTFVLHTGVYRMQSIAPKNDDTFVGQGGVVLNGSQVLMFQPVPHTSGLWYAWATATASSAQANRNYHDNCDRDNPLCAYSQDLFIDDQVQTPGADLSSLRPGLWYFDREQNKVYLASNPQGHMVELGFTPYAFIGPASNVTVRNLTVEKYASWAQSAAIGGDQNSLGAFWTVDTVEARWNHGVGIGLGTGSSILNSFVHHNGQVGLSVRGSNSKVIHNEISWNNYAGFVTDWEAGGAKFCATTGLLVQSNYVHDNNGTGLWTDIGTVDTVYEQNTVIHNKKNGIQHEISYGGTIRNNVVKDNGSIPTEWLWNAQILLQNSGNVQAYGNTVEVPAGYGNGIAIVNQDRGRGSQGPYVAANNYIHDNTITYLGSSGYSGLVDDTGDKAPRANLFDHNRYILAQVSTSRWTWFETKRWTQFQFAGQEVHGSCCK